MKRLFVLLLCLAMLGTNAFALKGTVVNPDELPLIVNEAAPSDWAVSEINAAYQAGLVPELTGSPKFTDAITREQFAELAVRTVDVIYGGDSYDYAKSFEYSFKDCDNSSVRIAASMGVVNGTGNGNFSPKLTTNREQIAAMLARAWTYLTGLPSGPEAPGVAPANDLISYTDYTTISDWALASVETLVYNGIISGTSATTLSPKDSCTVEQAILLCYRLYNRTLSV